MTLLMALKGGGLGAIPLLVKVSQYCCVALVESMN
jgi:hypothetical protein